jgi:transketolase N-terminal domain/subunit
VGKVIHNYVALVAIYLKSLKLKNGKHCWKEREKAIIQKFHAPPHLYLKTTAMRKQKKIS